MNVIQLPTIHKAFKLMVADNVASPKLARKIMDRVEELDLEDEGLDAYTLRSAEHSLCQLTVSQLEELSTGAQDELQLPLTVEQMLEVESVMTFLFEEIHP